jgi:hypothetical protein
MLNMIHIEDYEFEAQKDLVYLQEDIEVMRISMQTEVNKRQPAKIQVIDQDKMLQKQQDESKINTLPF